MIGFLLRCMSPSFRLELTRLFFKLGAPGRVTGQRDAADSQTVGDDRSPRSGRGGRRFKSCHSDQYLADNTTITGTDCGTVLLTLTDMKTGRISPIHDETEFPLFR